MTARNMDMVSDIEQLRRYVTGTQFDDAQLPSERALAETLGWTRTRLRTGLRKLEEQGLIWREGKGTYVGGRPTNRIHADFAVGSPLEVMEARMKFEPELAFMAAQRAHDIEIAAMRDCIEHMRHDDQKSFLFWDRRSHRLIAQAAKNSLMLAMFDLMQANQDKLWPVMVKRAYHEVPTHLGIVLKEHEEIVESIAAHNAHLAMTLMAEHLRASKARIL